MVCFRIGEALDRLDVVTAREGDECFVLRCAMREIGAQHPRNHARRIFSPHVLIKFASDRAVFSITAARKDVIALDSVAIVVDRDARAKKANVADVMLRAGMMTAGEMDIDRRVERRRSFAICGDLVRMTLGVRSGETTTETSCAGHEAGADGRSLC